MMKKIKKINIKYEIRDFFRYTWPFYQIRDTYYNIRNGLFRRYDLIRTGLPKTSWCDKDYLMLYGMMSLLVDYVEKEECFENLDWDCTPDHKNAANEIKEIYDWWKNYKIREEQISSQLDTWHDEFSKRSGDGIGKFNNSKASDKEDIESEKLHKMEADLFKEEDEMLIRLIKIRHYLWT